MKSLVHRIHALFRRLFTVVLPWWLATAFAHRRRYAQALRLLVAIGVGYLAWPVRVVPPGFAAVRFSRIGGDPAVLSEGPVLAWPLLHELRLFPMREQIYQPPPEAPESGFQSLEGLQ